MGYSASITTQNPETALSLYKFLFFSLPKASELYNPGFHNPRLSTNAFNKPYSSLSYAPKSKSQLGFDMGNSTKYLDSIINALTIHFSTTNVTIETKTGPVLFPTYFYDDEETVILPGYSREQVREIDSKYPMVGCELNGLALPSPIPKIPTMYNLKIDPEELTDNYQLSETLSNYLSTITQKYQLFLKNNLSTLSESIILRYNTYKGDKNYHPLFFEIMECYSLNENEAITHSIFNIEEVWSHHLQESE